MQSQGKIYYIIGFKRHFLAVADLCVCNLPASASACNAPEAVCKWSDRIVGIKTPNMIASGTMIADGFVVTNRHVAENHARVITRDVRGRIRSATPLAHNFAADLVILWMESANSVPDNAPAVATISQSVSTFTLSEALAGPTKARQARIRGRRLGIPVNCHEAAASGQNPKARAPRQSAPL